MAAAATHAVLVLVQENWRGWVALRTMAGSLAAPAARYGDAQLAYHYTKDGALLAREVETWLQQQQQPGNAGQGAAQ